MLAMMEIRIETHCHSCYSPDCYSPIAKIIAMGKKRGLTHIIINDHDCYGLSPDDENLFAQSNIELLKAIEFTTSEGVHIIGVHSEIKKLQKKVFSYDCQTLIKVLQKEKAVIIIPHPLHTTGVLGNRAVDETTKHRVLSAANFIETGNRKYGTLPAPTELLDQYPNLRALIGSDAHKVKHVAAFVNIVMTNKKDVVIFDILKEETIKHVINKEISKTELFIRRIKRSVLYHLTLTLTNAKMRKRIKRIFKL
jgi:predicted metal-dependent phosphoesterase TrpH